MIQLKTTTDITLEQAFGFEIKQNLKGISKIGMYNSSEPCRWLLKVQRPQFENGFKADVTWFQLQPYKPDADSEETAIKETQMYGELFSLTETQMTDIFNQVGLSIVPNVDNPLQKWNHITALGVKFWLEHLNKVFGEGVEFEIVE